MKDSLQNNYGATFKRSPVFYILTRIVILFFMIIIIFPLLYTLSLSVRSPDTVYSARYFLIPYEFSLQNYYDAFFYAEERLKVSFPRMFLNSVIVTTSSVFLIISLSIFAAFSFSHLRFPMKESLYNVMIASVAMPAQVLLIPLFYLLIYFGIINTYTAVILAYAGFLIPIGILILRMFFEQIPGELTEAGIVDGASDFQLLMRILLPLAKPAIATCVILLFLDTWNEFIYAMIFMQDPTIHTVPVGLAKIGTSRYHINIGTYSASVMITIIPVMLIFAIFQRWFIAGMTMGALKH
ncbi:MAG: carbohydrate ABC transporter permease [Alphaproteobacteria bacterium]|jgi:ABC-type glycerol-3-phosphate transport system permease component|tara:strand:- start:172 stop:1059 length:888 start_codon:yes stop_codon:yes gene_type:complete